MPAADEDCNTEACEEASGDGEPEESTDTDTPAGN